MNPSNDIERVAILIYEGGLPEKWALSLGKLLTSDAPSTHTVEAWEAFKCEVADLISRWHADFEKNDWTPTDIRGFLHLLRGRPVIAVNRGDVRVQDGILTERIYYRPQSCGGCIWEEGRRGA